MIVLFPAIAVAINEMRNSTTKTQNRVTAIREEVPAMLPKPRIAAINATIRKVKDQRNMRDSSGRQRALEAERLDERTNRASVDPGSPRNPGQAARVIGSNVRFARRFQTRDASYTFRRL
jgi:hypothetical protein